MDLVRAVSLLVLVAGLSPLPAQAGQPYSESLTDCAALFTIPLRRDPEFGSPDRQRKLRAAGDMLLAGAAMQAAAEGRENPAAHIDALFAAKAQEWDARGFLFIFSEEFRDWASYCRKFSLHLGIDLTTALAE